MDQESEEKARSRSKGAGTERGRIDHLHPFGGVLADERAHGPLRREGAAGG